MSAEPEFHDVIEVLGGCQVLDAPDGLEAKVRDAVRSPDVPAGFSNVYATYRDDAYSILIRLVMSEELSREAIEDAFFSMQRELDSGAKGLTWPEALRFVCDAGRDALRLLRKTGRLQEQTPILGTLDGDAQLALLLRREFGLSELELARALGTKAPEVDLRAAAAAFAGELKTPSHDGGELAKDRLVRSALDLLEDGEADAIAGHDCEACDVLAQRIQDELSLPMLKLPRPDAIEEAVAARAAKDREHRAAIREVQTKVSLNCTYCHSAMQRAETAFCSTCLAPHHADCFAEHGQCSAPGCSETVCVQPGAKAGGAPGDAAPRPAPGRRRWVWPVVAAVLSGTLVIAGMAEITRLNAAAKAEEMAQRKEAEIEELRERLLVDVELSKAQRSELLAELERRRQEVAEMRARTAKSDDEALNNAMRYDRERKRQRDERERALKLLGQTDEGVVILKNGREVRGIIVEQSDKQVVIQTKFGRITIATSEVASVQGFDRDQALRIIQALQSQMDAERAKAKRLEAEAKKLRKEAEQLAAEKERLTKRWEAFEKEVEERGLTDLVAEMRAGFKGDDTQQAREIEALFAEIEATAKRREVEKLIEKFARLRKIMDAYGLNTSDEVRANMKRWSARLAQFGEVSLSIELQVYINEGNQHLRAMAKHAEEVATTPEAHADLRERFEWLAEVCEKMRGEEREVFHRNAEALWLRGRALAIKGGAVAGKIDDLDHKDKSWIAIYEIVPDHPKLAMKIHEPPAEMQNTLEVLDVGMHVLVFFEEGDRDKPILALYEDRAKPGEEPGEQPVVIDEELELPEAKEPKTVEFHVRFGRVEVVAGRRLLSLRDGRVFQVPLKLWEGEKRLWLTVKKNEKLTICVKGDFLVSVRKEW